MATMAISRDDAIDAEFETLAPASHRVNFPPKAARLGPSIEGQSDHAQLDLLRRAFGPDRPTHQPDRLTPSFLFFTLIAALVVFWVSGGKSLLY